VRLTDQLANAALEFAEHYHDAWAMNKASILLSFTNKYTDLFMCFTSSFVGAVSHPQ